MSTLTSKEIAALKARAQEIRPIINVGKGGASEGVIQEIKDQLDRESLIKVKILKSALEEADKRAMAESLAEGAGAVLVELRGFTAVLYKPPRARRKVAN